MWYFFFQVKLDRGNEFMVENSAEVGGGWEYISILV